MPLPLPPSIKDACYPSSRSSKSSSRLRSSSSSSDRSSSHNEAASRIDPSPVKTMNDLLWTGHGAAHPALHLHRSHPCHRSHSNNLHVVDTNNINSINMTKVVRHFRNNLRHYPPTRISSSSNSNLNNSHGCNNRVKLCQAVGIYGTTANYQHHRKQQQDK